MAIYSIYADTSSSRNVRDAVQLLARIKGRPLIEMADATLSGRVIDIKKLGVPLYSGVSILAFGFGLINRGLGHNNSGVKLISFLNESDNVEDLDGIVQRAQGKSAVDSFYQWANSDDNMRRAMEAKLNF